MRVLFLGDIVGSPGVNAVRSFLPEYRKNERIDLVLANAENATNGTGLSPKDYKALRMAGVDAVTMGDHIYKKLDLSEILQKPNEPICKPANYPPAAPGRDHILLDVSGVSVAVISLLGRTFMRPVDCPFAAADRVLNQLGGRAKIVFVDAHCEATAEKYLLGHHLDGRVSAVFWPSRSGIACPSAATRSFRAAWRSTFRASRARPRVPDRSRR